MRERCEGRTAAAGAAPLFSKADFERAAVVLGWPIELDKESWKTAAPKASVGGRNKAGTLPIAAKWRHMVVQSSARFLWCDLTRRCVVGLKYDL